MATPIPRETPTRPVPPTAGGPSRPLADSSRISGDDAPRNRPEPYFSDQDRRDALAPSAEKTTPVPPKSAPPVASGKSETKRPLAYSAVDDAGPATAPTTDDIDDTFDDSILDDEGNDVPPTEVVSRRADRPATTPTAPKPRINRTAIWALLLSMLGITFPVGIGLGFKARHDIARSRDAGQPFATAALWVGFFYLFVVIVGFVVYFWIRSGN